MTFEQLNIIEEILKAIQNAGYTKPSPIQEQAIPVLLEGSDILGSAQTGSGKTAAFAIPILQSIMKNQENQSNKRRIKSLILSPTRELALQIKDSFQTYGKYCRLKTAVIYGGVNQSPQTKALEAGVDILVATPGRLLDLINQRYVDLSFVETFVLDEADRMLDMGFINDVNKIVTYLPSQRQTMLFSATMPRDVEKLANQLLKNPVRIAVAPVEATVDTVEQRVYHVIKKDKTSLLLDLLQGEEIKNVLVFTRTKHGANKLATQLEKEGIGARAIHGNKSQSAREQALRLFKTQELRVLVATDIASRGIDISELSHVINYELPEVPEVYIHRIGRTGRAGHAGIALTFCNPEEKGLLEAIERHIKAKIPVISNHNYLNSNSQEASRTSNEVKVNDRKKSSTNKDASSRRQNANDLPTQNRSKTKPVARELSSTKKKFEPRDFSNTRNNEEGNYSSTKKKVDSRGFSNTRNNEERNYSSTKKKVDSRGFSNAKNNEERSYSSTKKKVDSRDFPNTKKNNEEKNYSSTKRKVDSRDFSNTKKNNETREYSSAKKNERSADAKKPSSRGRFSNYPSKQKDTDNKYKNFR